MSPPLVSWGSASVAAMAAMLHASWRGVPCSASQKTGSRTSTANGECAPSWASRRSATTGKYAKTGMAAAQRGSHSQGVNSADRPIATVSPPATGRRLAFPPRMVGNTARASSAAAANGAAGLKTSSPSHLPRMAIHDLCSVARPPIPLLSAGILHAARDRVPRWHVCVRPIGVS